MPLYHVSIQSAAIASNIMGTKLLLEPGCVYSRVLYYMPLQAKEVLGNLSQVADFFSTSESGFHFVQRWHSTKTKCGDRSGYAQLCFHHQKGHASGSASVQKPLGIPFL